MTGPPWVLDCQDGSVPFDEIAELLARTWSVNSHVPPAVRMQIAIATGEIAGNIVEHAGRPVTIRMEVRVGLAEVQVDFIDDGPPNVVDLTKVGLPDEFAETGRGLAMAQAVLEHLSYRRNGLNYWTLRSKPY